MASAEILERIGRGQDVVLAGERACVEAAMAEAAVRLADDYSVVAVAAPVGGLSLSRLLAALSGRESLDDQDDAVLELGVRRLAEAQESGRRAVMLLDGSAGVHRSAFRFLRQVSRSAPDLLFVVSEFPDMAAMLAEGGMEALRARLEVAAPVVAEAAPGATATAAEVAAAPSPRVPLAVASVGGRALAIQPARSRRRLGTMAAVGAGMAASLALGAWFGIHMSPGAAPVTAEATPVTVVAKREFGDLPISVARTAAPAPVGAAAPSSVARSPAPATAAVPPVAVAKPSAPELAQASDPPDVLEPQIATAFIPMEPVDPPGEAARVAELALPRLRALRAPAEARRPAARPQRVAISPPPAPLRAPPGLRGRDDRFDQAEPPAPDEDWVPPVRYRRYNAPPGEWQGERAVAPMAGPYIGTYVAGPYGTRVFRYEN